MRNFCAKCVYIVILQFVLVTTALSNTLTFNEQGEVFAETDRYRASFKDGVLIHFHNKLTQETYTLPPQGPSNARSGISIQYEEGLYGRHEFINDAWEVASKRLAPLSVEVAYHSDYRLDKTVWIRISIDADTGDLVIQQHGISKHIVAVTWGCGYLNSQQVDVILPAHGGEIIDASSKIGKRGFEYPVRWEGATRHPARGRWRLFCPQHRSNISVQRSLLCAECRTFWHQFSDGQSGSLPR